MMLCVDQEFWDKSSKFEYNLQPQRVKLVLFRWGGLVGRVGGSYFNK